MHRPDEANADPFARTGAVLDGVAVCASTLCMIHCLVLPLVLAVLPTIAARFAPGESWHAILLAFAIPTSLLALAGGWRIHRALQPAVLGAAGLALMTLGLIVDGATFETMLTVAGSASLAAAHIINWSARTTPATPARSGPLQEEHAS